MRNRKVATQKNEELGWMIVETVSRKWAGHMINAAGFVKPERNMSQIGG